MNYFVTKYEDPGPNDAVRIFERRREILENVHSVYMVAVTGSPAKFVEWWPVGIIKISG
jgi:hypothetical protein